MTRTTTCTYHCSACGLHFHSLEAFDAHRGGGYRSNDADAGRRCEHPLDLDGRLVPLTVDGECGMHDDGSGLGLSRRITIWTSGRSEHPEARRRRLERSAQAERSGDTLPVEMFEPVLAEAA